MRIRLLGPMTVMDSSGRRVDVHGRRLRALLARLALDAGRVVSVEGLIDDLWGSEPPAGAVNAVQSLVSRLRRAIPAEVASLPGGYRLEEVDLDSVQFEEQAATGRRLLRSGEYAKATRILGEAEQLWHGPALADLTGVPFAAAAATRLQELRQQATEDRFEAELAMGRHSEVLNAIEAYAAEHPLRENVQAQLMQALARVGRQADALAVYDRVRQALAEDLGMDPSPELAAAQLAVLRGERMSTAAGQSAPDHNGSGPNAPGHHVPDVADVAGQDTPGHNAPDVRRDRRHPSTSISPRRGNLRAQLTSFVGRQHDLARLNTLLGNHRLITLVGPGGAGKTRLAIEVAMTVADPELHSLGTVGPWQADARQVDARQVDAASKRANVSTEHANTHVPSGDVDPAYDADTSSVAGLTSSTWFVALASVTDPHDLVRAVVSTLGLRESRLFERGPMEALATYRGATSLLIEEFNQRPALLILDNCEHLVDAAAELAETLVAACPKLRIMTTSREPLNVTGEVLYTVPPLAWPATSATAGNLPTAGTATVAADSDKRRANHPDADQLDQALEYPAVGLFLDRAASSRPDFELTAANLATVVEVCRRLDGMPLAIELAAAKVRTLALGDIADRLDDRFRLLTNGNRTALPRHQTLRAVIEWSWELLSGRERTLARRLAVFPGGATLHAAEELVADTGWAADVVEVLGGLVDKSFVQARMSDDAAGVVRYQMLETVRAFGVERLEEAGEAHAMRSRHAAYFLKLAETADPALRTSEQLTWLAHLRADYDNIVAAIRWVIDTGDADTAVHMCAALMWFWSLEGNRGDSTTLTGEALAMPHVSPPEYLATLYGLHAAGLFITGYPRAALRSAVYGLRYSRRPGAKERLPLLRLVEPSVAFFRGNLAEADRLALETIEACGSWARAITRVFRAHVLEARADITNSDRELAQAMHEFSELGERWGHAAALRFLANVHARQGDHVAALAARRQAWILVIDLGACDDLPEMQALVGIDQLHLGDTSGAYANLTEALELFARNGRRDHAAMWFGYLGLAELHRRTGDFAAAHRQLAIVDAELVDTPVGVEQWTGAMADARGWIAIAEADPRTAEAHFRQAFACGGRDNYLAEPNTTLGMAAVALADEDPGLAAFRLGLAANLRGTLDRCNPDVDVVIAAAQQRLGHQQYAAAYERGVALTREEARAAVLE